MTKKENREIRYILKKMTPNRNTHLFAKTKRPPKEDPAARAEKDRLIREYLEKNEPTRINPMFALWNDKDTDIWRS